MKKIRAVSILLISIFLLLCSNSFFIQVNAESVPVISKSISSSSGGWNEWYSWSSGWIYLEKPIKNPSGYVYLATRDTSGSNARGYIMYDDGSTVLVGHVGGGYHGANESWSGKANFSKTDNRTVIAYKIDGEHAKFSGSTTVEIRINTYEYASEAFAVYSADDGSLNFYKREPEEIPEIGNTFEGKTVTAVYRDIESLQPVVASEVPWYSNRTNIKSINVVDEGIAPKDLSYWFYGFENCEQINLEKLNTSNVTKMYYTFFRTGFNASSFEVDLSSWDVSNVTNMYAMFYYAGRDATNFELDLSNWNISKVTDMSYMFSFAGRNATTWSVGDISNWNTSKVRDMISTFQGVAVNIPNFELDLSGWNTSTVTNMSSMFQNIGQNSDTVTIHLPKNISSTASKANITSRDFYDTTDNNKLYQAGTIPTGNSTSHTISTEAQPIAFAVYSADDNSLNFYKRVEVPSVGDTFEGKTVTRLYLGIETDNVYEITTQSLNIDDEPVLYAPEPGVTVESPFKYIDSSVNSITIVDEGIQPISTESWFANFDNCTEYNGLDKLDTSHVTNMSYMFYSASSFCTTDINLDLNTWDVSNVTTMYQMFYSFAVNSPNVTLHIDKWNTSSLQRAYGMFQGYAQFANSIVLDLSNWDVSRLNIYDYMFEGIGYYGADVVIDLSNWDFTGKSYMNNMFSGKGDPGKYGGSETIHLPQNISSDIKLTNVTNLTYYDWDDNDKAYAAGTIPVGNAESHTISTEKAPVAFAIYSATDNSLDFYKRDAREIPTVGSTFEGKTVTAVYRDIENISDLSVPWERYKGRIESVTVIDKISPKSMTSWFSNMLKCSTFNLSNLDTSKINSFNQLFYYAGRDVENLYINLSGWDTSDVTDMNHMFFGSGQEATTYEIDLSGWNTSKVTDMSYMFGKSAQKATTWSIQGLNNLDVSNVTNMTEMFSNVMNDSALSSYNFELDLSGWNISKVTNMDGMFSYFAWHFNQIELNLSGWDATNVTNMNNMFYEIGINASIVNIKLPKNINSSVSMNDITSNIFYDATDNYKEYPNGSIPTGNAESHTITTELPYLTQTIMIRYENPNGTFGDYIEYAKVDAIKGQPFNWTFNENPGKWQSASINEEIVTEAKTYYLDILRMRHILTVNATLDGVYGNSTLNYGTFDIYVNGELVADDVTEANISDVMRGVSYEITDIKALDGKTYNGISNNPTASSPISGTIQGDTNVILDFTSNKYNLYFDANGGSVDPEYIQVAHGTQFGTLPTPSKAGHTFIGWFTDKVSGSQVTSETVMGAADVTVYAHWSINNYTATFNLNGGDSVSPSTITKPFGDKLGTLPVPQRVGHDFVGWFTEPTGGTQINELTQMPANNVTYYAHWEAKSYTLTFNANGGEVSPANKVITYGSAYGELPIPTYHGYEFNGWYTSSVGGTQVDANTILTGNTTIYAQWLSLYRKIYLSANGVDLEYTEKDVIKGEQIGDLPYPQLDKYVFKGWFTEENGQGTQITSATIMNYDELYLYAYFELEPQFTKNEYNFYSGISYFEVTSPSGEVTRIDVEAPSAISTFSTMNNEAAAKVAGATDDNHATTFTATENGIYQLKACDSAQPEPNCTTRTVNITNIDKDGPTIEYIENSSPWTNTNITVQDIISDDQSGVKEYAISVYNQDAKVPGKDISNVLSTPQSQSIETIILGNTENTYQGQFTIQTQAKDALGNTTNKNSGVYRIDRTKPSLVDIIYENNADTVYTKEDVDITVRFTDGSGTEGYQSGISHVILPDGTRVNFPTDTNGNGTYGVLEVTYTATSGSSDQNTVRVYDKAGNELIVIPRPLIDKIAPTILEEADIEKVTNPDTGETGYEEEVTITITNVDHESGPDKMQICIVKDNPDFSGCEWVDTTDNPYSVTIDYEGKTYIKVKAWDKAGNMSEKVLDEVYIMYKWLYVSELVDFDYILSIYNKVKADNPGAEISSINQMFYDTLIIPHPTDEKYSTQKKFKETIDKTMSKDGIGLDAAIDKVMQIYNLYYKK